MLAMLILLISSAWAAPDYPEDWNSTRLVLRGVGDSWDDTGITSNYGMGSVGLGIGVMQPIWGPLAFDIEFTYKRLREGGTNVSSADYNGRTLQMIPVTALVQVRAPISSMPVELFVVQAQLLSPTQRINNVRNTWTLYSKPTKNPACDCPTSRVLMRALREMSCEVRVRV